MYTSRDTGTAGRPQWATAPGARRPGAAPGPASEHPFGPDAATILASEHWSLLSFRSLIWNEAMSRATVFLSVLSTAIITLALLSSAAGGSHTTALALVLLPVVLSDAARIGRSYSGDRRRQHVTGAVALRHHRSLRQERA